MTIRTPPSIPNRTRWLAILLGYLAVFTTAAHACLWDTDTLKAEAAGLPGVVEVITGRFDRFPPLYYEMRLERVSREVEDRPDELELYDDAGVALDRLGRSGEAIAWMARKLEAIERLEAAGEDVGEHRYRYLANLGTFHAHRWLKSGADREEMADVERARELIAAAIEINPDAHFGRERYQLLAIEWLLLPPADDPAQVRNSIFSADRTLPGSGSLFFPDDTLLNAGYGDAAEGLAGLIVLGAAWESTDIFESLSLALANGGNASVAMLAQLRVEELRAQARESLRPVVEGREPYPVILGEAVFDDQRVLIRDFYEQAREESKQWQTDRFVYMMERFGEGQHPDTHPEFWGSWVETSSPPSMPNGVLGVVGWRESLVLGGLACVGVGVGVLVLAVLVFWRLKRTRASSTPG